VVDAYRGVRVVVLGASGFIGSQVLSLPVVPTGLTISALCRDYLPPPEAYLGRHRAFAIFKPNVVGGSTTAGPTTFPFEYQVGFGIRCTI